MPTFQVQFKAMGSQIQAWLCVPTAADAAPLQQVPAWFEEWEAIFSRFRDNSELAYVNAHPGEWTRLSPIFFSVLKDTLTMAEATNGLINPLVLPALQAAGYDHSFDPDNFTPGTIQIMTAIVPDWRTIRLWDEIQAVNFPATARLDLGGIVKGWAAEQAAERLAKFGPCMVDAGGDIVGRGDPDSSGGWLIRLSESGDESILLHDAAVATSGTDYRRWQRNGQTLHHLIDPRTGQPSTSPVLTATVVAPYAVQAEAWAKAALLSNTLIELPTSLTYSDGTVRRNDAFNALLLTRAKQEE